MEPAKVIQKINESYDMYNVVEEVQADLENLITNLSSGQKEVGTDVVIGALKSILRKLEENVKEAW